MSDIADPTMTSQQAKAVVHWLDGQTDDDHNNRAGGNGTGKGKEVWRPDLPEKPQKMLHRLPYPTYDTRTVLRVVSMNLCSAVFGFNIVIGTVVKNSPRGMSILDVNLNWIISLPVTAMVFAWELSRFILSWRRPWDYRDLRVDVAMEAFLGVVTSICSILAAFQTAQHRAFNARNKDLKYQDVWLEMGLAIILGFLAISCFGIMAVSLIEALQRRGLPQFTRRRKGTKAIAVGV